MRAVAVAVILALAVPAAFAQDGDRYALEKSGDGVIRMDRQTGEMTYCETRDGALACRAAADAGRAADHEIARLQEAIAALDRRVVQLENSLAARLESSLPTEEEFEKTLGYMERFVRGFMGVVRDMEKAPEAAPRPDPNKT
jgi:hypothetical protein